MSNYLNSVCIVLLTMIFSELEILIANIEKDVENHVKKYSAEYATWHSTENNNIIDSDNAALKFNNITDSKYAIHSIKSNYVVLSCNGIICGEKRVSNSSSKDLPEFKPAFIDRKKYPYLSLKNINFKDNTLIENIDDKTSKLLHEYIIKLQLSKETKFFNPQFDFSNLEKKFEKSEYNRHNLALSAAFFGTWAISSYLIGTYMPGSDFSKNAVFIGSFCGAIAAFFERMNTPLGKLLMRSYSDSVMMGTEIYESKIRNEYLANIHKHLIKRYPKHFLLKGNYHASYT